MIHLFPDNVNLVRDWIVLVQELKLADDAGGQKRLLRQKKAPAGGIEGFRQDHAFFDIQNENAPVRNDGHLSRLDQRQKILDDFRIEGLKLSLFK